MKFQFTSPYAECVATPVTLDSVPEWPLRRSTAVAYPISRLQGNPEEPTQSVSILASFQANPTSEHAQKLIGQWLDIRALKVSIDRQQQPIVLQGEFQVDANGFSSLAIPKTGSTRKWPVSGFLPYELDFSQLWDLEVGDNLVVLQWQYKLQDEERAEWMDVAQSIHTFYLLLDAPQLPWGTGVSTFEKIWPDPAPRRSCLALACHLAKGSTTTEEVIDRIMVGLANMELFTYETSPFYSVIIPPKLELAAGGLLFKYPGFMDRLRGFEGEGGKANCMDFAYIVVLLANSLGADLKIGQLVPTEGTKIDTHPVIVAGKATAVKQTFDYHEFAFRGESLDSRAKVYDLSLYFPAENEGEKIPVIGMTFDAYLDALIGGITQELPTASTSRRFLKIGG